jgi:predicted DNA-binding transcriptional regulator AlpA
MQAKSAYVQQSNDSAHFCRTCGRDMNLILIQPDRLLDMEAAGALLGMPSSTFWEKHLELNLLPVILHPEFRSQYRWSANEIYTFIAKLKKDRDDRRKKALKVMEKVAERI